MNLQYRPGVITDKMWEELKHLILPIGCDLKLDDWKIYFMHSSLTVKIYWYSNSLNMLKHHP